MRVFVTGASGFVGAEVTKELQRAGHTVVALARSDASAEKLQRQGVEVIRGDLDDPEALVEPSRTADGVIHCAFVHDFSNYAACCAKDRKAIEIIGSTLAGTNKPFVVTSGTLLILDKLASEDDRVSADCPLPRAPSETLALSFAQKGVRVTVLRLPPSVHGDHDHGFLPFIIASTRAKKLAAYVGDGTNSWSAVDKRDAAVAYRLALEKGVAGAVYQAVADEVLPFKDIAATVGKVLDVPVASITKEEAGDHYSWLSHFVVLGHGASSTHMRALGWTPTHPGLLEDLETSKTYFSEAPVLW